MDRVQLIKEALDLVRIRGAKWWGIIGLFNGGVGFVTVPVLEDGKEVFRIKIEIVEPVVELIVKQESFL